jgi:ABC-type transport system involved in cytochrome bd biosynthesis fused ATPase/permease subunit
LKKAEKTKIGEAGRIKGLSGGEKRRLLFASEVCFFFNIDLVLFVCGNIGTE